jgi:hypothetical protein
MKLILNPRKEIRSLFKKKIKGLESKVDKDSIELHKIESTLSDIKKMESQSANSTKELEIKGRDFS